MPSFLTVPFGVNEIIPYFTLNILYKFPNYNSRIKCGGKYSCEQKERMITEKKDFYNI